jgi:hypothetical protein
MGLGGALLAYLLVGSIGPEFYGADDVQLLVLLAGLIGPQVGGFLRSAEPSRPFDSAQSRPFDSAQGKPAPPTPVSQPPITPDASAELLLRIASLLATTSEPAAATRLIAEEGSGLLPFDKLIFALRLTEGDRVILVQPGERRALPNLPLVPVAGTPLSGVLRGELPRAFMNAGEKTRLVVPLRVAGKVHGALIFSASSSGTLTEAHVSPAQRLADIVAAHLELLRRAAAAEPPRVPLELGLRPMRALPATPPRSGASVDLWQAP